MKIEYKDKIYITFKLNYIDGEPVKANLYDNKVEVVVLKDNIKDIRFIYN